MVAGLSCHCHVRRRHPKLASAPACGISQARISERAEAATLPQHCFFRASSPSLRTPRRGGDREHHSFWRPSRRASAWRAQLRLLSRSLRRQYRRCSSPLYQLYQHVRRNRRERAASVGQSVHLQLSVPNPRKSRRPGIDHPQCRRHATGQALLSGLQGSPSFTTPPRKIHRASRRVSGDPHSFWRHLSYTFQACLVALVSLDTHLSGALADPITSRRCGWRSWPDSVTALSAE